MSEPVQPETPTGQQEPTNEQASQVSGATAPGEMSSQVAEPIPEFQATKPSPLAKVPWKKVGIVVGAIVLILLAVVVVRFILGQVQNPGTTGGAASAPAQQVTLEYWGLWEPTEVVQSTIKEFQDKNPGVKIVYSQQSVKDYRERLQSSFSRGQGPDIFRFHNTWIPMFGQTLSTVPSSVMSDDEYSKTFYPIAVQDLKTSSGYVGMPLMVDGLGLYVNKKAFTTAGKSVPKTWDDMRRTAREMTIRGANGAIERAGAGLGSSENVDHFSDILALLILQNGGYPGRPEQTDPNGRYVVGEALQFYSQFMRTDKVWDETLPNSTYAFANEKAAMILAPSWRAFEIRQINPNLEFEVHPVPQLPGEPVTWASYWVEGVAKSSEDRDLAWKFVKFLAEKETMRKLFTSAQGQRLFGEPYSRMDLSSELASNPYAGAYMSQAPTAKSWFMASRTFDNGLNDQIIKYYQDAINAMNKDGRSAQEVLPTLGTGVTAVLKQYGIPL